MPDDADAGATVLVVDDAPPNVKLLRLILKDAGYRVLEASSGPEALDILHREKPDALVLDVRMPGMTGYEVCRQLRSEPEFATLPVIMVTALSMLEERIQGIEAGATDFITKPFSKKELLARLRTSLDMAAASRLGIVPQFPGAVVVTDPEWNLLGLSPLAATLLGLHEPGIRMFNLASLMSDSDSARAAAGDIPARFRLRGAAPRMLLDARQHEIADPAGGLLLRIVTLSEADAPFA